MAKGHTGSRNSLEDPNSNSAKAKNAVENCFEKSFKEINSALQWMMKLIANSTVRRSQASNFIQSRKERSLTFC